MHPTGGGLAGVAAELGGEILGRGEAEGQGDGGHRPARLAQLMLGQGDPAAVDVIGGRQADLAPKTRLEGGGGQAGRPRQFGHAQLAVQIVLN
jgi:hypothetical protein